MEFFLDKSEEKWDFTGEEIATFKRYIEENNVCNDNAFEFYEKNLDYFAFRYTRDKFDCMAEHFHVNSDFWNSNEMIENIQLYEKSVQWRNKTVHPENSEYVIKEEKYLFIDSFPDQFCNMITTLNKLPVELFSCIDLLIYVNEGIYQYLPHKNFVFTWKKNGKKLIESISKQFSEDLIECVVVIPIFVPIRKMMFLGEYGYREAMIDYGCVISEIMHCSSEVKVLRRFENRFMNQKFHLDGVEKSIFSIIFW